MQACLLSADENLKFEIFTGPGSSGSVCCAASILLSDNFFFAASVDLDICLFEGYKAFLDGPFNIR
jgi:hypothetical protein